ncbi:MAG: cupredoxin domain-containing protein [Candidatus Micrarchaeota archaeon]|nr:cupredoxin domain-containing protein [Candidatus Micrarchaeota archaeon]
MAIEKYAFAGIALLAVAFAAFVVMGSGAHAAGDNANPAYALQAQPSGSAQSGSAASGAPAAGLAGLAGGQTGAAPSGIQPGAAGQAIGATQEVSLTATSSGYDKTEIRVKAGVPVHFSFTANGAGCCSLVIIDKVGVQLSSSGNTVDATFTPPAPGNYPYHCGMNMCRGVLIAE